LEPRLEDAKAGKRTVFFVDAAHFVLSAYLGFLWCFTRVLVRAPSGRQRFNVLGALNAVTHQLITVTNDSYINSVSVGQLLEKIAALGLQTPITLIMDNARYQRCKYVLEIAARLNIEILFLPPYSPNLNLIERLWKFVRKDCLYDKYYEHFSLAERGYLSLFVSDYHHSSIGSSFPSHSLFSVLRKTQLVTSLSIEALCPDQVALALAALAQLEQEERAERKQWDLRLERTRYEAKRAERQYQAVEPENRLVARSLERLWEDKLRTVETLEKEYQAWSYTRLAAITEADRAAILTLGSDLTSLWQAETTTNADRKHMLRLVIRDVIVDGKRTQGQVWFQINWQTGAHEEFCYKRSVQSYEQSADVEVLQQRIRELNAAQKIDAEIAIILNAEGYRTARLHRPITLNTVWQLREKWHIPTVKINGKEHNPAQWEDGTYSVEGAAARLGVFPGTIHKWLKGGKLTVHQLSKGMPWKVSLTEEDVTRLQEWLRLARR